MIRRLFLGRRRRKTFRVAPDGQRERYMIEDIYPSFALNAVPSTTTNIPPLALTLLPPLSATATDAAITNPSSNPPSKPTNTTTTIDERLTKDWNEATGNASSPSPARSGTSTATNSSRRSSGLRFSMDLREERSHGEYGPWVSGSWINASKFQRRSGADYTFKTKPVIKKTATTGRRRK